MALLTLGAKALDGPGSGSEEVAQGGGARGAIMLVLAGRALPWEMSTAC